MNEPQKEEEAGKKKHRAPKSRTNEIYASVFGNPNNVFGQTVFGALEQKGYSIALLLRATGLHIERLYNLLQVKNDFSLSSEPEIIFRIADYLGFERPRLLALYLLSNARYHSPTYRGQYVVRDIPAEDLVGPLAALITIWEGLVHAPTFEQLAREEQAERELRVASSGEIIMVTPLIDRAEQTDMVLRVATLVEIFLNLDAASQQSVLTVARSLDHHNRDAERVVLDPRERSKKQMGVQKKPPLHPKKTAKD